MGLVAPQHVESSQTRDWTGVPCIDRQILTHCTTREVLFKCIFLFCYCSVAKTLCNTMDYAMPGSFFFHYLPELVGDSCSHSCPLSWWCYLTILSSAAPFSFCLQPFPATGSVPVSQLFSSRDQNIGTSASVLPVNIQGWYPWELTGLICLQSKRLWSIFSDTTLWKHLLLTLLVFHDYLSMSINRLL